MTRDEAIARLRRARAGTLATVRPNGSPHVVPFVFAIASEGEALTAFWAVDDKPKTRREIQRIENIEANPSVEFVVDGYDDDWSRLWWVRAGGRARVVSSADERTRAVAALGEKYTQYTATPPDGAVIAIEIDRVTGWSAAEPSSAGRHEPTP
jgi:PPOX class probable F420-dependent enzyme